MNSNFLTNYSHTDGLVNFMRFMFALTQTLTYPLELFVARHAVHALFFSGDKKFSNQKHYTITLLLWGSSLAIALNVAELGIVLELTGGISAVFIGFVMPAMLMFKLSEYDWRIWRNPPERRMKALKTLAPGIWLLTFGILAMSLTLLTVIKNLLLGGHAPHDAFEEIVDETAGNGTVVPTDDDPWWNPTFMGANATAADASSSGILGL